MDEKARRLNAPIIIVQCSCGEEMFTHSVQCDLDEFIITVLPCSVCLNEQYEKGVQDARTSLQRKTTLLHERVEKSNL